MVYLSRGPSGLIEAKPKNLIGDRVYESDRLDEELKDVQLAAMCNVLKQYWDRF